MKDFWAKTVGENEPGISVRDHCLNVGCVAEALMRGINPFAPASLVTWLAACHDIGKVAPGFQGKCEQWLREQQLKDLFTKKRWPEALGGDRCSHSKVSQFTIQHVLRERFRLSKEDAATWAAVAGMHHGEPHFGGQWQGCENKIGGETAEWESLRRELADELALLLGEPTVNAPHGHSAAHWWTAGLITVADWIGSDEENFSPKRATVPATLEDTHEKAKTALTRIGMGPLPQLPDLSFDELFGFPAYDLQTKAMVSIRESGVYVIEAPMGMGKTEAALAAAYGLMRAGKASGIYFALPTQATSNRIHERVASFLSKLGAQMPRLIHSGSWLLDKGIAFPKFEAGQPMDARRESRDWFASSKRALMAPFGVGTVDQALMGVIAVKHFFVRHYALAGKVVIIDEVHSYDGFTGTLVEALIRALSQLGCTIIILSATLTRVRRAELLRAAGNVETISDSKAFPLITGSRLGAVETDPPQPKPPVQLRFRLEADCLEDAIAAARAGACVLWICNTVDKAQAVYKALCNARCAGDPQVGLLHSRFTFADRERLERRWMCLLGKSRRRLPDQPARRLQGCFLISTQIVEQSVDLDADLLITELAPTDMLFQRMGRLWRHWENGQKRCRQAPETWIIAESESLNSLREMDESKIRHALGKKAKVYQPYVLLRTLQQWHDQSQVRLPEDIRDWLELTYADRDDDPAAWKVLRQKMLEQKKEHLGKAETAQNLWNQPALKDEEGIGTRLNTCPTLPLVLTTGDANGQLQMLHGQKVRLQEHYFDYATAKALHRNMVKAPRWWFGAPDKRLQHLDRAVSATLQKHLYGGFEAGVVEDLKVTADSLGDVRLEYSPVLGLLRKADEAAITSYRWEDDDSYDY